SAMNGVNVIKAGDGDVNIDARRGSDIEGGLIGISANSIDGDGNVNVSLGNNVDVSGGFAGILAGKAGGSGNVDVEVGGRSDVEGYAGVLAYNLADGNVTVSTGRGARVAGIGVGIAAGSIGGDVSVSTGNRSSTVAADGSAIIAAAGGEVTVRTRGMVRGEGADDTAIIQVLSGEGAHYRNTGLVASLDTEIVDAAERMAVNAKGSAIDIVNDGIIVGRFDLSAEDDTVTNGDTWLVRGVSDFGDGTDELVNHGYIRTSFTDLGGETAEFAGLETFF